MSMTSEIEISICYFAKQRTGQCSYDSAIRVELCHIASFKTAKKYSNYTKEKKEKIKG